MREDPKIAELESALFVASLMLAAQHGRLEEFGRENAHLRVVAQRVACPYGHRHAGGCELGYPGCACMDDIIHITSYPPETDRERYVERLERRSNGLTERVRIAASHFHSMAEGFRKSRQPSKAAACQGMADLMEDRL
jgi:hypothetical protein